MSDRRLVIGAAIVAALVGLAPVGATGHGVLATAWAAAGAVGIAAAIRRQPRVAAVWWLLLGFLVLRALGSAASWIPFDLGGASPRSPAASDLLLLGGHVVLAAGLLAKLVRHEDRRLLALDLAVIASAASLVLIAFVLAPALSAPGGVAPALHVGYAAADVVLFALWLRMLLTPRPRSLAFDLIMLGTGLFLAADLFTAEVTAAANVQAVLFAAAALHRSTHRDDARRGDFELHLGPAIVLGLALLVGPLLMGADSISGNTVLDGPAVRAVVVAGSALVAFLVIARIVLLLRTSGQMAGALQDALQESDAHLLVSQSRLQALVENIPAVTFIADATTSRIAYMSPQLEGLLGYAPDEWAGGPEFLHKVLHPDDRDEQLRRLAMALALGTGNHSAEFRMVRADERVIWVRQDIVLTREHGRTVILGFWVDIDKRKFAQAERDEMELELRLGQRLEAVGQLAAGVAHEINTPIQFVGDTIRFLDDAYRDLSELLAAYEDAIEQGTVPADVAQRLEDAASEADIEYLRERIPAAFQRSFDGIDRVATIVQALRSFAHPPSADKAPTDLNAALRNTLTVARSEYKYVAEVEELFDDLPLVNADVGDLGQVFLNLIVNAAHAIEDSRDDGGQLGRITVSTHVDGEHVVVSVSDTGGGIPPEVADRVFEPFFTTKDVGRGTGQGLAIARTIVVDRHNGSLTFETAPGAGTTFHIRLPITGEAPPVPAQVLEAA